MTTPKTLAAGNMAALQSNPYPGRGIVIGRLEATGEPVQLYWIMGRSANSRNRRFVVTGETLRTEPVDASAMADPSLVIYTAMDSVAGHHVVSNGDHTDTISQALRTGQRVDEVLRSRHHEPDAPNHTPRIAGGQVLREGTLQAWLAIIRADPFDASHSSRFYFQYGHLVPGFGFGITTYRGDGEPLPSFGGEPLLLPLAGDAAGLLEAYWNALWAENRISLALKVINPETMQGKILVKNRFGKS